MGTRRAPTSIPTRFWQPRLLDAYQQGPGQAVQFGVPSLRRTPALTWLPLRQAKQVFSAIQGLTSDDIHGLTSGMLSRRYWISSCVPSVVMPETSPCSFEIQPYVLLICLHRNHQVDVHHIHRKFGTCVMMSQVFRHIDKGSSPRSGCQQTTIEYKLGLL